jgi:hypothetical protein
MSLQCKGCWIAPRDVKAGALYADAIVRAISSAKAIVLVLSDPRAPTEQSCGNLPRSRVPAESLPCLP